MLPALAVPLLVLSLAAGQVPASLAADTAPPPEVAVTGVESNLEKIIQELRDELGESSEAMVRAAADLRLADAALPDARRNAAEARRLLGAAMRRQEQTALARGKAQVQLILTEQEAAASAAAVAEQQARIGALARAAYQSGGSVSSFSILLESRSPADFAERMAALRTLSSAQRSVLTELETVQQSFGSRTATLQQVRDTLAAADERAQRELATVMALEVRARAAEETVARLITTREAALAAARAAQAEEDAAAARRETVSSRLKAVLDARARQEAGPGGARDGSTVPAQPGALAWPVTGRLSSPFGMRVHPITGVYKLHTGQDIGVSCGTPIRAARDGVVLEAGWNSAYGWRTVISHGSVGGVLLTTTYNHQQRLGVTAGEQVDAGQVIGEVGSTGYSTGCHLHFELFVNSTVVDPLPWLS